MTRPVASPGLRIVRLVLAQALIKRKPSSSYWHSLSGLTQEERRRYLSPEGRRRVEGRR